MGRRPCCPKEINKGAWSREEDETLSKYVAIHGEGKWQKVAQNAGKCATLVHTHSLKKSIVQAHDSNLVFVYFAWCITKESCVSLTLNHAFVYSRHWPFVVYTKLQ